MGGARKKRAEREPTLREEIAESGETPVDETAEALRADREDLAFLAREFLTWLVYHAEVDGGAFDADGDVPAFTIAFGGKLTLRTMAGMVTDVTMKGPSPVGSPDLRYALAGGLSVKEADLRLEQEDRTFTFALAAENFDLKRVKLPALLADESEESGEAERVDERLMLLGQLEAALRVAFARFLALRMRPAWTRTVVPAIRAWLEEGT